MIPMNAAQDSLHEAIEAEAGMTPDHPSWNISLTKQVYDMIRDSIKVEDIPYLAISIFERNFDSVGRSIWIGCIDEMDDFAGDADLGDGHE